MMVRQFVLCGLLLLVGIGGAGMGGIFTLGWRSTLFFALSGICGGAFGLWTYYHALRLGGASLVIPVTATYPLVTAILSRAILQEAFTLPRLIGTVLIVTGVWLVT
jgi:bacterial/archaeal transporter family protein